MEKYMEKLARQGEERFDCRAKPHQGL